jgi:hypothetical protein
MIGLLFASSCSNFHGTRWRSAAMSIRSRVLARESKYVGMDCCCESSVHKLFTSRHLFFKAEIVHTVSQPNRSSQVVPRLIPNPNQTTRTHSGDCCHWLAIQE